MQSTGKLDKTTGSNYAVKLAVDSRRSSHTGLNATATLMSSHLPTIQEDGVEAPKFQATEEDEEGSVALSRSGLKLSKLEGINLNKLKD